MITPQARIVVFTGNLAHSVRKGIVEIDRAMPGLQWLIVVHAPSKTARQLVASQRLNLRRNGWRWIPYQTADVWQRLTTRPPAALRAPLLADAEYGTAALEARPNVQVLRVADIHAQPSLDAVRDFAPDLGLSLAAPILRRPLFSIPRLGTVNLHKGKVPDYRGMPPAFWELWNDERSVGCTVHRVDDKLDTGDIVRRASVERAKFSTVRGLQLALDETGVELMRDAVVDLLAGRAEAQPQPPHGGTTYRKPTLAQAAALERKLGRLQPAGAPAAKRAVKRAGSALGLGLWRFGLGQLAAPRVTVLLYHRVSDDARDNLTVGVEQFDRQMALLRRHCRVLSIEQVLGGAIAASDRPQVAVTFDDGYLDNYANAAPILVRHGVPAAFFVSTGIVNTPDARFPHDVRRGNPHIPVMTWDQLRRMRDWGFTIGSHSVRHIDCAAEPEDVVRAELAESRDALRRELGIAEPLFAYPYGGRRHMTAQRLDLVKQAGYAGCLSAYGGSNVGSVDRYNVLRRGIHWEYSDGAFLFECLGAA